MRKFPDGTDLRTELKKAMDRLTALGVVYPDGYYEALVKTYESEGVDYPRTLMRIGEPNIVKHPKYREILEKKGDLLDYGCGTGDDIRALIRDGYPKDNITGFDIDWNGLKLGFDLYRDTAELSGIFKIAPNWFERQTFDVVYSGSVLHTLECEYDIIEYLINAETVLRSNGILFGSTLGTDSPQPVPSGRGPRTLLTEKELERAFDEAHLVDFEISKTYRPGDPKCRFWFSASA